MVPKVADIIRVMEGIAPSALAEEWDNSGLQAGGKDWPVKKVWIALDPSPEVIDAACVNNIDLLITHHPLMLNPLKSIDFSTYAGSAVYKAARHHLAVFSAHTNLDNAADGLNDVLAEIIGLKHTDILSECTTPADDSGSLPAKGGAAGMGRVGDIEVETSLMGLAGKIKEKMGLKAVRISGPGELKVKRVAICTGSGSSLMKDFLRSGAQAYVSGDIRYHDAREAEQAGRGVIDIGHFGSEHVTVATLADRLQKALSAARFDVRVEACGMEKDPFTVI